jgi:hypothetical protein
MTERKAKAGATAKGEADPYGMTARKAKARADTGVSPLRFASVEMTGVRAGMKMTGVVAG